MKKALITGISGQDGSYLAEYLLELGLELGIHGPNIVSGRVGRDSYRIATECWAPLITISCASSFPIARNARTISMRCDAGTVTLSPLTDRTILSSSPTCV